MLASDLILNASTAIPAGTNADRTLSALPSNNQLQITRSVAATALTAPQTLKVAHSVRTLKGLTKQSNDSVAGAPILFDRHLVRLDNSVAQSVWNDSEFRINRSIQIVIEVPRLGGSSPTTVQIADDIKALVAMLCASANANLIRVLNGES